MNHRLEKKNRILLTTFLFIVAVIFVQIIWWILFQINHSRITSGVSLKLAEKTRYVAAWHLHHLLTEPELPERATFIAGTVLIQDGLSLISSGDSTGFSAARQRLVPGDNRVHFSSLWMARQVQNGQILYEHLNALKLRDWLETHYPEVRIYDIATPGRQWFIQPEDLRVSDSYIRQVNDETEKLLRMFVWEGSFFILLMLIAVALLYTNIRAERIHSHQVHNFMLTVTHELKSPVASVRLYLETLLRHDPPKEKRTEFLQNAVEETARLDEHIENILSASRLESQTEKITFTEVNLFELMESWFSTGKYAQSGRVFLDETFRQDLWIQGDEKKLQSVFFNLADNALKYSEGQVLISSARQEKTVTIRVKDTGQGIPREAQPFIFDKFFRVDDELTRNTKGAGLGLFIAAECVKLHKGTLSVESEPGKGSEFSVTLPVLHEG